MKKVLLATTALTLSAGIAAAEGHSGLKITGFAEMGIADNGTDDVQFFQDIDVTFAGSGTTDNGLTFGFSIDLDEVQQEDNGDSNYAVDDTTEDGGASVFVSGDFGSLTLGDTDGAFDWALTEVAALGSIADDHTSHDGYSGNSGLDGSNDGQVLRYDHSVGDFSFAVSLEQDDLGTSDVTAGGGDVFGLGVKGSFGDISVGFGYQENDATEVLGLSVGATFGDIAATVNWWDEDDGGAGETYTALGLTYTSGPLGLHINYGQFDTADTEECSQASTDDGEVHLAGGQGDGFEDDEEQGQGTTTTSPSPLGAKDLILQRLQMARDKLNDMLNWCECS